MKKNYEGTKYLSVWAWLWGITHSAIYRIDRWLCITGTYLIRHWVSSSHWW